MTYANDFPNSFTDEALQADAECIPPMHLSLHSNSSLHASLAQATSQKTIPLSDETLDRARTLSQTVRPAEQWQAYQNAIALFGVQEWLAERGIDISDELETCSVYGGAIAGLLSGVCRLQVNGFQVCLVPIGSLTDDGIAIPRATLELEAYVPQLFIGIDVREESQQVTIWGSLRLDMLRTLLSVNPSLDTPSDNAFETTLCSDIDWTYRIPRQWFSSEPDDILLYLRCLEPESIPVSPVLSSPQQNVETLQSNLPLLRHRLQSFERSLWKLLSWSQASLLLDHPDLADALLAGDRPIAINTAQWLRGQLDELTQAFNWQLLPPLGFALRGGDAIRNIRATATSTDAVESSARSMRLRSSVEQFEDVVGTLSMSDLEVPSHARATVLDIPFGDYQVRLYVIIWDSSTPSQPQEWSLTTVLGFEPNSPLPGAIHLSVADEAEELDHQHVSEPTPESYLCSKVIGDWQESFWLTIDVDGCESLTLPPFTYFPTAND